ncbi:hypothetical protein MAUB1S_04920 [Mycolicibacterium aubagnense]
MINQIPQRLQRPHRLEGVVPGDVIRKVYASSDVEAGGEIVCDSHTKFYRTNVRMATAGVLDLAMYQDFGDSFAV